MSVTQKIRGEMLQFAEELLEILQWAVEHAMFGTLINDAFTLVLNMNMSICWNGSAELVASGILVSAPGLRLYAGV